MKNISPLQIGLYVLFIAGIVFAVLVFSGKINIGQSAAQKVSGTVTMWGILPYQTAHTYTESIATVYPDVKVTYVEKNPATLQADLVEALASGRGPDLLMVTPSAIVQNSDRIFQMPFTSLSQQAFLSTFVDQGQLFVTPQGILALPILVDPMVMYYNRDLLTSSFVVKPPETWTDVVALNKLLTKKDDAGKLLAETAALGTVDNILHAKDLLIMLSIQAGSKLIGFDPTTGRYASYFLLGNSPQGGSPVAAALGFFTSFSNSNNADNYSWNGSLPMDQAQFLAGKLALYFGYASEMVGLRAKNPNLNFGVAMMPQSSINPIKSTYGRMIGLAVMKASKNSKLAFMVSGALAQADLVSGYLQGDPSYAPARKDLLAVQPADDAVKTLIYKSAIISRSWLDPEVNQTQSIFKRFIDQVNAGAIQSADASVRIDSLMQGVLGKVQAYAPAPVAQ